jgi:hypothetical protein
MMKMNRINKKTPLSPTKAKVVFNEKSALIQGLFVYNHFNTRKELMPDFLKQRPARQAEGENYNDKKNKNELPEHL